MGKEGRFLNGGSICVREIDKKCKRLGLGEGNVVLGVCNAFEGWDICIGNAGSGRRI